jgi:ABC-2 type transport system ATP-binding protein
VLADVGMSADADAWYETLSGGQQRRTCVATAVVNDPDLLFLDEPTTGIDPAGRRALNQLIARLATDGTTVFLTSHAMDEVERLADRVMLLRDGEVVAVGPPAALIAEHAGRPRLEVALRDPTAVRPGECTTDDDPAATGDAPTGGDLPAVEKGVSAAVTDVVNGAAVEPTTDGLRILGIDPVEIGSVVDALATVGVGFDSLTWAEPSLEDVYLRLTGETYSPRSAVDRTDAERRADGGTAADGRTPADDGSHTDSGSPTDDEGRPHSGSRGDGEVR